jgi:hypothetical protein
MHAAYHLGRALQAGRVWTNCYHLYPADAAFGGYKQSGIGRENRTMISSTTRDQDPAGQLLTAQARDVSPPDRVTKAPDAPVAGRQSCLQSRQVRDMTAEKTTGGAMPLLNEQAGYLISMAARAPSVHNTQPWRFAMSPRAVELRQRDFDLGRGLGLLTEGGGPPTATAILLTSRDRRADWLRAGQTLQRLLLHAASQWVFAALYTQPLEAAAIRQQIKTSLAMPGWPQIILQLGVARSSHATARRSAGELTDP